MFYFQAINRGVIGITFVTNFLEVNGDSTVWDAVGTVKCIFYISKTYVERCVFSDHINHVREIAGVQSIAIGSDFCGISE